MTDDAATPEAVKSPTKGLWWKSFVLAWVLTRLLGVVFVVVDVRPPDAVGVAMVLAVWAAAWVVWRRRALRSAAAVADDASPGLTVLRVYQRTTAAFAATVVFLLPLVVALDAGRTGVPVGPVAAAIAAITLLALVGSVAWVPKLPPPSEDVGRRLGAYRSRLFAQLAWATLPILAALGAVALVRVAWVYAIGAAGSLAIFALIAPTAGRLRPDIAEAASTAFIHSSA